MQSSATTGNPESAVLAAAGARLALQQVLLLQGAHEIRNQLAIILLQLGKLADGSARQIESEVRALSQTVDRLALLARLTGGVEAPMVDIDIAAITSVALTRVGTAQKSSNMHVKWVDQGGMIHGHQHFVCEAICCLLENAYRHSPTGRRIIVTNGPGPIVTIDDDGPGFPEHPAHSLAAPFAVGRSPGAGAGLGLTIANEVARLHGGDLEATKSELGGARVVLRLAATNRTG